jgi:hypothetical protein
MGCHFRAPHAHIKKLAAERAEKLAAKAGDEALAMLYSRLVLEDKLVKANELFVTRFSKELDSTMDLPTLSSNEFSQGLKRFLENPTVQDALVAPMDAHSELDWQLLRGIWMEELDSAGRHLPALPLDFDWAKVAKIYRHALERLTLTDPGLRSVVAAMATLRLAHSAELSARTLDRLAGPARIFDILRYAASVQQAYFHLKLGSLDSDWTHVRRDKPAWSKE